MMRSKNAKNTKREREKKMIKDFYEIFLVIKRFKRGTMALHNLLARGDPK